MCQKNHVIMDKTHADQFGECHFFDVIFEKNVKKTIFIELVENGPMTISEVTKTLGNECVCLYNVTPGKYVMFLTCEEKKSWKKEDYIWRNHNTFLRWKIWDHIPIENQEKHVLLIPNNEKGYNLNFVATNKNHYDDDFPETTILKHLPPGLYHVYLMIEK